MAGKKAVPKPKGVTGAASYRGIMKRLGAMENPDAVTGMARFGINPANNLGIQLTVLRKIARKTGTDHALAGRLWASGVHDARLLACLVERPELVTDAQAERWVRNFNSWDVCDLGCGEVFCFTPFAHRKALEWTEREEEFVKRAGFALIARLAVRDKKAADGVFRMYLPVIRRESTDGRNYVRKAVNWALRQIGKRNPALNRAAIAEAERIRKIDSKSARWIASDALRELKGEYVKKKLGV